MSNKRENVWSLRLKRKRFFTVREHFHFREHFVKSVRTVSFSRKFLLTSLKYKHFCKHFPKITRLCLFFAMVVAKINQFLGKQQTFTSWLAQLLQSLAENLEKTNILAETNLSAKFCAKICENCMSLKNFYKIVHFVSHSANSFLFVINLRNCQHLPIFAQIFVISIYFLQVFSENTRGKTLAHPKLLFYSSQKKKRGYIPDFYFS